MAGRDVEIAIQRLHVDDFVDAALAAVDQHFRADGMGEPDDFGDRRHRAQHIGHMGDSDKLGFFRQQLGECSEIETVVGRQRRPQDLDALALAQKMPGHDIGVMLHLRNDDLVAFTEFRSKARGDEIDRLRAALGEDDFLDLPCVHETAGGFARLLEHDGRFVGKKMRAAMDVGVGVGIGRQDSVEHNFGLLR